MRIASSLRLHADVHVGGLAGDGEVSAVPGAHECVGRALIHLLGLLVGRAEEAHADGVLLGRLAHGTHHGREAALHVVGPTPDQAVSLHARLELLRTARDHVEVPVQDHGGRPRVHGGTDVGLDHRQTLVVGVPDVHVAGLEPTLDEARRGAKAVERRGVVGDQALGERPLVHHGQKG
jgi:hypothetical protein